MKFSSRMGRDVGRKISSDDYFVPYGTRYLFKLVFFAKISNTYLHVLKLLPNTPNYKSAPVGEIICV